MRHRFAVLGYTLLLLNVNMAGQESFVAANDAAPIRLLRADGGSMRLPLSAGRFTEYVNGRSTLTRQWVVVNDSRLPVAFYEPTGPAVIVAPPPGGEYLYEVKPRLVSDKAIAAVEVRFLLFDVWRDFERTLSMTEIEDVSAGVVYNLSAQWDVPGANEAAEHWASIGYIARVRLQDGTVVVADTTAVLDEARKAGLNVPDLEAGSLP